MSSLSMAFKAKRATPSADHVEETPSPFEAEEGKEPISDLKLDAHGLPLVPQPSDHKDDPLVCRVETISLDICQLG